MKGLDYLEENGELGKTYKGLKEIREWLPIAYRIGKYDESYPRKVIHDKYLEGLEDKEETI